MAVSKPLLTEFGIHHRLESCAQYFGRTFLNIFDHTFWHCGMVPFFISARCSSIFVQSFLSGLRRMIILPGMPVGSTWVPVTLGREVWTCYSWRCSSCTRWLQVAWPDRGRGGVGCKWRLWGPRWKWLLECTWPRFSATWTQSGRRRRGSGQGTSKPECRCWCGPGLVTNSILLC